MLGVDGATCSYVLVNEYCFTTVTLTCDFYCAVRDEMRRSLNIYLLTGAKKGWMSWIRGVMITYTMKANQH